MTPSALSRRDALKLAATAAAGLAFTGSRGLAQGATASARAVHPLTLGVASYTLRQLPVDATIAALEALDIKHVALHRAHLPWTAPLMNAARSRASSPTRASPSWLRV